MASDYIDALKARLAFAGWSTPDQRPENVFLWHLDPRNIGIEGWTIQHVQIIARDEPTKALRKIEPSGGVRITDSLWIDGDDASRAIHLNTYECASRQEARLQALRVFADFQGPPLDRTGSVGEVAFQTPKKTTVLFIRGNVVSLLRNGGERLVNVAPHARSMDERLTAKAPANTAGRMPAGIDKESVSSGRKVAVTLPDPADGETIRIIARGGEVRVEKGKPVYAPQTAGQHEIAFVLLREGSAAAAARATVTVR